jgi:site-specific DNA-methyltransferase (adenine-specific)
VWYGKFWGRIQGNNKERCPDHDNQLPEVYLERVVRACSDEGMLVMDPFVGSGTTGVVAHALGRNFIGIEYSEDNAQRAAERIKRGPIRELNGGGQSTAIFPQRVVPRKKRARRAKTDPDPTLL